MASEQQIDQKRLREVAGRFVTGVAVVTTASGGTPRGATVNAITCLSLDPPLYLACLSNTSSTLAAVRACGAFGINFLSRDQTALAQVFASKAPDKFDGVGYELGASGVPLLRDAVASIECQVTSTYDGGDHTIVVGVVRNLAASDQMPLVMRCGKYVQIVPE